MGHNPLGPSECLLFNSSLLSFLFSLREIPHSAPALSLDLLSG